MTDQYQTKSRSNDTTDKYLNIEKILKYILNIPHIRLQERLQVFVPPCKKSNLNHLVL